MPHPFETFLEAASSQMAISSPAAHTRSLLGYSETEKEAYVRNKLEREFLGDLVERVKMIAFSYERLTDLTGEHGEIYAAIRAEQPGHGIDLSRLSPDLLSRDTRWRLTAETLSAFIYYETKSVTDMIGGWRVINEASELGYFLKVRNFFLAHPSQSAFMRRPRRTIQIPAGRSGPVLQHMTGTNRLDAIEQEVCVRHLGMTKPVDLNRQRSENEEFLRRLRERGEDADPNSVLKLNTFGTREPDLDTSLRDLAQILEAGVSPRIALAFANAVDRFGFQRSPRTIQWPY